MFRSFATIILSILIFGCASQPSGYIDVNQLGVDAARCIVNSAEILDDGISPADTITVGIMSKCQQEIDAYDYARLPRGSSVYAVTVWNNRHIGWNRQITSIVLESRAKKRSGL